MDLQDPPTPGVGEQKGRPPATTGLFMFSLVSPFSESRAGGIRLDVVFSDWLLSLRICIEGPSVSICGLTARFFLALNNLPLSGWTTVYPFTSWRICCPLGTRAAQTP